MDWAVADCRLALDIAVRQGYPWLEAAASRTWTEIALARGKRSYDKREAKRKKEMEREMARARD